MEKFITGVRETLADNTFTFTENGAFSHATTGKNLLDMSFKLSSYRHCSDGEITRDFAASLGENFVDTIIYLFMARDVRGGMGERRFFRVCLEYLAVEYPNVVAALVPLIAEYGRWDDLLVLFDDADILEEELMACVKYHVKRQFLDDVVNMMGGKPISLLAKWLPSEGASSEKTKARARYIMSECLDLTPKDYRKTVSRLRAHLKVVERDMSANEWGAINYEAVPSQANMLYNKAFLRHDEERRRKFLEALKKGEAKINASTLFPHDIVHRYMNDSYWRSKTAPLDETLEQLWKALPDTIQGEGNTLVVQDGSGSMGSKIGNGSVTAMDVSRALAIYFAERCSGPFKNQFITFSSRPQWMNLNGCRTLKAKIDYAAKNEDCSNTNIEAVFDMILETAVKNKLSQDELPKNVLVISDMEFDNVAEGRSWGATTPRITKTLFQTITVKYERHGYKLPRLIFWNVASRTNAIPVKENGMGVALVSGFSPNVAKMVLSGKLDPFECLLEQLHSERYELVRKSLSNISL